MLLLLWWWWWCCCCCCIKLQGRFASSIIILDWTSFSLLGLLPVFPFNSHLNSEGKRLGWALGDKGLCNIKNLSTFANHSMDTAEAKSNFAFFSGLLFIHEKEGALIQVNRMSLSHRENRLQKEIQSKAYLKESVASVLREASP